MCISARLRKGSLRSFIEARLPGDDLKCRWEAGVRKNEVHAISAVCAQNTTHCLYAVMQMGNW